MFLFARRTRLSTRWVRNKVTVVQHDATGPVKRPAPVVLVQSSDDKDTRWPKAWQAKLGELGYQSTWVRLEESDDASGSRLDTWYQDLCRIMQQHSYFPPLVIGHGLEAWRVNQKYVCNKPVSGLVLVHGQRDTLDKTLPSMEFEPYFPLLVVSPKEHVPDFLLDDDVDRIDAAEGYLEHTLAWMDENGM
ncbi:hypothetical protein BC940DRAFT_111032 [Gongronella butleri]|nr:hypothetical protein BC940DRAFT_111032 [Gongronella butleri]